MIPTSPECLPATAEHKVQWGGGKGFAVPSRLFLKPLDSTAAASMSERDLQGESST